MTVLSHVIAVTKKPYGESFGLFFSLILDRAAWELVLTTTGQRPRVRTSRCQPGLATIRVQELCESRGGLPGLSYLINKPYGFYGRKATLNHAHGLVTVCP